MVTFCGFVVLIPLLLFALILDSHFPFGFVLVLINMCYKQVFDCLAGCHCVACKQQLFERGRQPHGYCACHEQLSYWVRAVSRDQKPNQPDDARQAQARFGFATLESGPDCLPHGADRL